MPKEQYFAEQSPDEFEEQRLRLLESLRDSDTTRRMEEFGVGPGWNCLEVGAGSGSIALWLAERVGFTGRVVAADINPRFLERIQLSNLDIRRHDVCEQDFEPEAYHLVHCRGLLMHLPTPEEVLNRMAKAVRPGGWIFVEEPDFGSFGSVDPTYPGAADFDRSNRVVFHFAQTSGSMQSYFARRLPGLVKRLGFENFGYTGTVRVSLGRDDLLARFWSLTARTPGPRELLIAAGVQTREQLDHVLNMYDDDSFEFVEPVTFAAWARRP